MSSSRTVAAGDAFAYLYDGLMEDGLGDPAAQNRLEKLVADPTLGLLRGKLRVQAESLGGLIEDTMESALASDSPLSRLAALLALDDALAEADPNRTSGRFPAMRALKAYYEVEGRWNRLASGAVMPRRSFPGRPSVVPECLDEYLNHVVRLDAVAAGGIKWRLVEGCFDIPSSGELKVAAIPFLEPGDVQFALEERGHARGYVSYLSASTAWDDRVDSALRALDASDAHIGLIPELSLDDTMVERWIRAIRETDPPPKSPLRWILIGTGDVSVSRAEPGSAEFPVNRAVMVSRDTGDVLLVQDKRRAFTLGKAQTASWLPAKGLPAGVHRELIQVGETLSVLEGSAGRIAISICEDLGRQDSDALVRSASISHLLVPILAPPFRPGAWPCARAEALATYAGSNVASFTSYGVAKTTRSGATSTLALVRLESFGPDNPPTDYPGVRLAGPDPAECWCVAVGSLRFG